MLSQPNRGASYSAHDFFECRGTPIGSDQRSPELDRAATPRTEASALEF
jgi:hypothetical protein